MVVVVTVGGVWGEDEGVCLVTTAVPVCFVKNSRPSSKYPCAETNPSDADDWKKREGGSIGSRWDRVAVDEKGKVYFSEDGKDKDAGDAEQEGQLHLLFLLKVGLDTIKERGEEKNRGAAGRKGRTGAAV